MTYVRLYPRPEETGFYAHESDKEQSLVEEEREENIRDLHNAYNHMRKLLDKYKSIIKVQEKELLDKK